MRSVPGVDHPEEQCGADVMLADRGISVNTRVEFVQEGVIVVRPSVSGYVQQFVVAEGDDVEVYWRGPENRRMVPARVLAVEHGAVVRWRLEMTGSAEANQRRKAVRARVVLPVVMGYGSEEMTGESVDLSEDGMRATVRGDGTPPDSGSTIDLVVNLDDYRITTKAEVIRCQPRGARWLLSLRFLDLEERDGDRLRRRVFQALREERARAAG